MDTTIRRKQFRVCLATKYSAVSSKASAFRQQCRQHADMGMKDSFISALCSRAEPVVASAGLSISLVKQ
jgi:hypothetical protein